MEKIAVIADSWTEAFALAQTERDCGYSVYVEGQAPDIFGFKAFFFVYEQINE